MSRQNILFLALSLAALQTACSAHISSETPPVFASPAPSAKQWSGYSDQPLAGKVFGAEWKAVAAVVKPFGISKNQVSLEIYSEKLPSACNLQALPSKPIATIVLPKDYKVHEYEVDLTQGASGDPLVFSSFEGASRNLIASQSRVNITALTESRFEAFVYAKGADESGETSEINGKVSVTDCSKVVDFSVWDEIAGVYTLQSFDGTTTRPHDTNLEYDSQLFADSNTKKYLTALVIPLYGAVSDGSTRSYEFGPIQGIGTTKVSGERGEKTFQYSYHGPIIYKGFSVTLNLDLKAVQSGSTLEISYTLEVPQYISIQSHRMVLGK